MFLNTDNIKQTIAAWSGMGIYEFGNILTFEYIKKLFESEHSDAIVTRLTENGLNTNKLVVTNKETLRSLELTFCTAQPVQPKQVLQPITVAQENEVVTRSFLDIEEVLKQHRQGLLTDGEMIMAVQLNERQTRLLSHYNHLPFKAMGKLKLSDLD